MNSNCYLVNKDLFNNSLSIKDLISKEEKTVCFGYKLDDSTTREEIEGAIHNLSLRNIPFYIISKKKDFRKISSILLDNKNYTVRVKGSYMEVTNNKEIKSYILCLKRPLSNKDKEKLIDFKPIS